MDKVDHGFKVFGWEVPQQLRHKPRLCFSSPMNNNRNLIENLT